MNKWQAREPGEKIEFFSYNGLKVAYRYFGKSGTKKTILFLYGFGGNIEMVSMLCDPYLSKEYSVLTVDYPGHCYSPDNKLFSIEEFTGLLIEMLHYLNEKEIELIGYSLGGMIALKLYQSKKIKINSLIMLHSASSFSYNIIKKIFYHFLGFMLKINFKFTVLVVAMEVLKDKYFSKDLLKIAREVEMYNNPKSVVEYFDEIIFKDYTPILKEIDCPTLVIGSKLDTLATVYTSRKTKENIKNSEIVIFNDIGHLSIVTQPEKIYKIICDFLSSHNI